MATALGTALHYECDRDALPAELRARFEPLTQDVDTQRFVERARIAPHGALRTAAYGALRRVLSDYDAYGLLGMYPMHLLSTAQLEALLGARTDRARTLLDVGAGAGDITCRAQPLFQRIVVTEASAVMRLRLRARGLYVLDHDLSRAPLPGAQRFDAISCLNVLDRCAYPRTLLHNLRDALAPAGRLLLATPLPLDPHVQHRGRTADPEEALPVPAATGEAAASWEACAASLANLLSAVGLRIERLSRAPYICRGDAHTPLHVLDDAVFVCSH